MHADTHIRARKYCHTYKLATRTYLFPLLLDLRLVLLGLGDGDGTEGDIGERGYSLVHDLTVVRGEATLAFSGEVEGQGGGEQERIEFDWVFIPARAWTRTGACAGCVMYVVCCDHECMWYVVTMVRGACAL